MERKQLAQWILIAGLVIVFGWFGIDKFRNPILWTGFLPAWMEGFMGYGKDAWIGIVGATEILLAVMLVIPVQKIQKAGALLITLHLSVVLWQVGWNDIGVRDLGLLMMSTALFTLL